MLTAHGDGAARAVGVIGFEVVDWAAYAPGISSRAQWRDWSAAPFLPQGEETPALAELPPMMRRRIDRLGRIAIQSLTWCRDAQASHVPVVFASRHGDVARSQQLLETLAADEPLSPAGFGLSVHNAIAALYAIAYREHGNYSALAAGTESAEAAVIEAVAMLHDGVEEVLVVVYDAVIPAVHAAFLDEPDPSYAWAWRLRALPESSSSEPAALQQPHATESSASMRFSLTPAPELPAATHTPPLPHGLDVLRFVLSGEATLAHRAGASGWRWQRHA